MYFGCCIFVLLLLNMPDMPHDWINRSILFYSIPYTQNKIHEGAQWLSGRVLDLRPKGRGFEPHWRHCDVVLEQDTFILA